MPHSSAVKLIPRALQRFGSLAAVIALVSIVGLASHNDGDPGGGHPSATGYSLGALGAINTRLRDAGPIRVFSDASLASYSQAAIDRWNVRMARVVFQSVGSAP